MKNPDIERLRKRVIETRGKLIVAMLLATINGHTDVLMGLVESSQELAELEHKLDVTEFMGDFLS